jgi:hypothetical protein
MDRVNALSLDKEKIVHKGTGGMGRIEIHLDRVAVWTLIFTNTFLVAYFFAKLFRWI